MATLFAGNWAVRGATFVLWGLAGASAVYWGLKFTARPAAAAAVPVAGRATAAIDPAAVARLLGASPLAPAATPAVALASRFSLVGVAARPSGTGAALISVDGKPAKAYRVGSVVDEGVVLQSVKGRHAVLVTGAGQPVATLELPPLTAAGVQRPPPIPIAAPR